MLNKQIIKDAIAEAKEIEKFAIEQAKKSLEEALMPQLEKAIQETLEKSEESENADSFTVSNVNESVSEAAGEIISENQIPKNIQEMEINKKENLEEELFEVEGLFEEEAPEGETATEPSEDSVEAKLDDLAAKIDQLIAAAKGGEGEEASAEGEVEVVDDEAGAAPAAPAAAAPAPAAPAPAPAAAPAPEAPAQTVTEDMEEEGTELEEVMFEIEEDYMNEEMEENLFEELEEEGIAYEVSLEEDMEESMEEDLEETIELEGWNENLEEEMEEMFEIQLGEEMEESEMEESRGLSFVTKKRGPRYNHQNLPDHSPVTTPAEGLNESKIKAKIKAQYESKLDELIKENESLKGVIKNYKSNLKEFESSFVELKTQLNEMQIFNGKLAYANKLLTKGGLTNEEKIRIAEEFDKCPTVEDAKKLYNKIISENKFSGKETIADKLKSAKPSTANVQSLNESKSETLFESEERKRMKMLAGLVKPINE
jgi:hypothetical protein